MDPCCSGQELKGKIKNPKEVEKRVGGNGMWFGRRLKWRFQRAVECMHPHINHNISIVRCGPQLPPVLCLHVTTARLLAGLPKLARGETNKFDITFFAILLLDDPGMKHIQPGTHMQTMRTFMLGTSCHVNYIVGLVRRPAGAKKRGGQGT